MSRINRRNGKSRVLKILAKKEKLPSKISGLSCSMIIIDDPVDPEIYKPENVQNLLDKYKDWYDKKIADIFKIPESAITGSGSTRIYCSDSIKVQRNC